MSVQERDPNELLKSTFNSRLKYEDSAILRRVKFGRILQETVKKFKIYSARAELLFCSLNLLFGNVLVEENNIPKINLGKANITS